MFKNLLIVLGFLGLSTVSLAEIKNEGCDHPPCFVFSDGSVMSIGNRFGGAGGKKKEKKGAPFLPITQKYAKQFEVDIKLIYASMWALSKNDPDYVAPKVSGLFAEEDYILDKYHKGKNIHDPDFAIMLGTKHLAGAQKKYKSPTKIFIAAFLGEDMLLPGSSFLTQPTVKQTINEFNEAYKKLEKMEKEYEALEKAKVKKK